MRKLLLRPFAPLAMAGLVFACSQSNTGDEPAAASSAPSGIDAFLLFPNPIVQASGGRETDTTEYAAAYYRAIDTDPLNPKDTLANWKTANGFGGPAGTEHLVVFRDVKDLGYGRRMTGRRNTDGSIAFFVENYSVEPNSSGGYSSILNVEAAIRRDTQWHVGTNAIEWSASPCTAEDPANCDSTVKFAKYYNFSSADGTRQLAVDLDGKGKKAMPGPCITCHGGRGDPLTPVEGTPAKPRFPLVENSLSRKRGDVQARLQGMNVDSFQYSSQPGFTKAGQQASLKDFNQWILCTYPAPGGATVTGGWGTCTRPTAGPNEWQGTAAEMIEAWYGGPGMSQGNFQDNYVPTGWNGNPSLYTNVVAPFCRTCHIVRGTVNQSDIDFTTLAKFQGYADRIKSHVFDRGNMPLALIVYEDFWKSSAPDTLATYIDSVLGAGTATSTSGAALKPGRPVANPGPNRMVRTGADAKLSAANSLFATSYSWTPVSGPTTPLITSTSPTSPEATFQAATAGAYTVQLTVSDGVRTDSKNVVVTVDNTFPDPSTIRFAQIQNVMQNIQHNGTTTCTSCHTVPGVSPAPANTPPIFYNNFDRNASGVIDSTDEAWFLKEVTGRVNLTEIDASPLLRKPSGNHHNGGTLFDLAIPAGPGLRNFSIFYNWILAGMPAGGVAANAGADSSNIVTFGGSPLSANISLDGSLSFGPSGVPLTYSWTVVSQPTGGNALPASPTSAVTTLNVQNVGVYVVQLQVSGGGFTDTAQRTITVSETPIGADFAPATGNTPVSFSGAPLRGNVNLTSTSTGSPGTCRWQVSGPSGATLDGSAILPLDVTKTCGTAAVLNVPSSAVGGTYSVTLTATSGLGTSSNSVSHNLVIQSAGSGVTAVISAPVAGNRSTTFTGTSTVPTTDPISNISLTGSASTGPGTLTFQWSVIGPAGATIASPTSANTILTVAGLGAYTVTLFVSNGLPPGPSNTATVTFTAIADGTTFSQVWPRLQSFGATALFCTGCHAGTGNPANNSGTPPGWQVPNPPVASDINALYTRVFQRVSTGTPKLSLLLLNPSNVNNVTNPGGHGGGLQTGFDLNGTHNNYDLFLNWIIGGALNN